MLCYRDMTFCESDCQNTACGLRLTEQVWRDAERWWGNKEAPVAVSDYSNDCPAYQAPENPHA